MAEKIESLKIESFKAFKDEAFLKLDKLNLLLYGENGAGKSSIYDAVKLIFFYHRIKDEHRVGATPEEQRAQLVSYLSDRYNHRGGAGFRIKVNDEKYEDFIEHADFQDYHVSMICNSDIQVGDFISYKNLLNKLYIYGDVNTLMEDELMTEVIADEVNTDLKESFKEENVSVAISRENELKCSLKGPWSEETYIENIRDYFNEAIINLIVIVLLLNTIKALEEKGETIVKILVLDDIITSLDASNRMLLMRYVQKKFPEYQKFIFTHNISFYNLWIYTINNVEKESESWKYMNVYNCGGKHKIYEHKHPKEKEKMQSQMLRKRLEAGKEDLQDLGNDIRKYFEELLHEFSKIVHVGGKNECSHILERLESNKTVYLHVDDGHHFKTAEDMLDHMKGIMGLEINDVMMRTLRRKYADYRANKFFKQTVLPVIMELRMFQKLSMHPLSHAHLHGVPTYTEKELRMTIVLIEKFEGVVNELMNFDVSTI